MNGLMNHRMLLSPSIKLAIGLTPLLGSRLAISDPSSLARMYLSNLECESGGTTHSNSRHKSCSDSMMFNVLDRSKPNTLPNQKFDNQPVAYQICDLLRDSRARTLRRSWLIQKKKVVNFMEKFTILLVDDSEYETDMVFEMIKTSTMDVRICQASNALRAVEELKKQFEANQKFHLVLMDMNIPHYNGLDGAAIIRDYERAHDLPATNICLLYTDLNKESEKLCEEYQKCKFLCKPITLHKLNKIVQWSKDDILALESDPSNPSKPETPSPDPPSMNPAGIRKSSGGCYEALLE